ncbi:MAG: multicopper oxidase family protein [Gammaproteobacteria bacterium]
MKNNTSPSRRRFFRQAGAGFLAWAGLPGWLNAMEGMAHMPKMSPRKASPNFIADVEIDLICKHSAINILSGKATRVLQYVATLVKGPSNTLTDLPGSYLGPVMRFEKGQKIRINLHNQLDGPTITHWHGLHVPADADGHPVYEIDKGQTYVYEFEMLNRASMNIYHPHTHNHTGEHVYHGLAGAILVNDEEERKLELPSGQYEVPIVIQDRLFDNNNQLIYVRHMHDRMMGFYGDTILVNGLPNFHLDVESRAYRFRILNASTARIYKLAWDDNSPVTVIGTDGGLLESPIDKPYAMLAPGERLDVWMNFSGRKVGTQLVLRSRPFSGVLPGMGHMMGGGHDMGMHGSLLPVGSDYPIFSVKVARQVGDSPKLPKNLSKINRYTQADTANPDKPVPISISERPMRMVLNGRPYAYNDVLPSERIPVNTVQLMEIFHSHGEQNVGGQATQHGGMRHGGGRRMGMMGNMGMMMSMAHPIHMHGQYFQIVSRTISNNENADYATVKDGFVDDGWKDTVLVMPGERVKLIKPFEDFKGLFMFHCHNLEHEDMGMMRDFLVE